MPSLTFGLSKYGLTAGFGGGQGVYVKRANLPMGATSGDSRLGAAHGRTLFFGFLPGAQIDWQRKAGDAWKNGVISAAISFIGRNLPYAPLAVFQENAQGEEEIVPKHPLAQLLKRPNRYYDGKTLLQATFLSLIAGRGNAYWWVKRANNGQPLEFWYLPHFEVWPVWDKDSTTDNWIRGYGYRQNGTTYYLKESEVIHFRDGLDPEYQRSGLDPMKPLSRELVTDNGASGYAAQLLENMCIPGAVISPDGDATIDPGDMESLKAAFEVQAGGDNRFRPLVFSGGVKVDKVSFSPQELTLDTMQDRPEARLCAQIGISPMVLGLMVGLEHSTYSNMEQAHRAAWQNCIMPRIALICSELDTQVLVFYPGAEALYLSGDYRKVPALQDNMDNKFKRLSYAVGRPFLTVNEARAQLGLLDIEGGDELYQIGGMGAGQAWGRDDLDGQQSARDEEKAHRLNGKNGQSVKELAA